jgi:transcriptional regulator with XRE-family HTH domain
LRLMTVGDSMDARSPGEISNRLKLRAGRQMAEPDRIGARVAAARKIRGWGGRELARRAQVSYSLLTKVESGATPATPAFIGAVARALKVDVTRLTGQPYENPDSRTTALQATIDPFRRALLTYDLLPATGLCPRPLAELRADVKAISLLSREARYLQLGHRLPGLLEELQVAIAEADDRDRPELYALLAQAYGGGSALAHQLGYLDLRAIALDRIDWASRRSGDPLRIARTQWSRGASLLGAASYDQGLVLMERTRASLGADIGHMDAATRSIYGSLHLRSAVLAARAGRRQQSDRHLAEARDIATRVPEAANHYGMEFGLANVGLHEVSAAVEMADGTLAVTRAQHMEARDDLTALPPERIGHYRIELARGWLYHGNRKNALRLLRSARRAAPQLVRNHPMVRETVRAIARAETRPNDELRSFAMWLGIES